jgi:hypothetical protein
MAGSADFLLSPLNQTVPLGATIEIKVSLSSTTQDGQAFDSLDLIFSWDPTRLDFLSSTQAGAGYSFFIAGFLPNPDGINLNLDDGLAMFTALGPPGLQQIAPEAPDSDIVTTLRFKTLAPASGTLVDIVPTFGAISKSRVLLGGAAVTGSLDATAAITITPAGCGSGGDCFCPHGGAGCNDALCCTEVCAADPACCASAWDAACATAANTICGCRADIDGDGSVGGADLASLLGAWGACPCCPSDLTADGQVDGADLATLLGSWGLCP